MDTVGLVRQVDPPVTRGLAAEVVGAKLDGPRFSAKVSVDKVLLFLGMELLIPNQLSSWSKDYLAREGEGVLKP